MDLMPIRVALLALVATAFATFAQAQQPAPAPTQPSGPPVSESASSAYILGRDDVIEVGLLGGGAFGGRVRVQADGTVQLPFIGKVPAADRTSAELSETIRKALQAGGFFSDPVVTVEVVGYASRYVVVLGAVGTPGLVPINRPYRVSEILARVGGVREGAADYLQVTSADGKELKLSIRDLASGGGDKDPFVKAGDKIYSPTADTFYIYGQVNTPGNFAISTNMTVRMAIARAGGLTESGSDKKVDATRGGKKVKLKLDDPILPGDVLVVGERLF